MTDLLDQIRSNIQQAREAQAARKQDGIDHIVEALHTFVRDGNCAVTVRIQGIDAAAWEEIDADYARTPTGLELKRETAGPDILIEYELDPDSDSGERRS